MKNHITIIYDISSPFEGYHLLLSKPINPEGVEMLSLWRGKEYVKPIFPKGLHAHWTYLQARGLLNEINHH